MNTIRIYCPESGFSSYTLRDVFQSDLLPVLESEGRAEKTLVDYRSVLNDWERLMGEVPAAQLSRPLLIEFRNRLQRELLPSGKVRSEATVNKKMRTLSPLIRICWPADSHNPEGMGLCDYFRMPQQLTERRRVPLVYTRKQISELYRNAVKISWPKRWGPLTWRTIFSLHYTCGPRTFDLLSLKWCDVDFEAFKGIGAITFQALKTGKLQRIPLNPVALKHLRDLRSVDLHDELLFPTFQRSNYGTIRKYWRELATISGLPKAAKMETFRKTCNTVYNERWPGVGDWILGHALNGVNARSYFNPTRSVLRAVRKLPIPEAFRES